jgi:hypothetical protein
VPRGLVVVAALLALALGGCDASGKPAPEQEGGDAAAIRADLAALYAGDHPGAEEAASGDCFAEAFTELATQDELREAGVLDASYAVVAELPELPPELADAWVEAQFGCSDFVDESTNAQVKITQGKIDAEEYAACLRQELTEDEMRAATASSLTGDWDAPELAALADAQGHCAQASLPPAPE